MSLAQDHIKSGSLAGTEVEALGEEEERSDESITSGERTTSNKVPIYAALPTYQTDHRPNLQILIFFKNQVYAEFNVLDPNPLEDWVSQIVKDILNNDPTTSRNIDHITFEFSAPGKASPALVLKEMAKHLKLAGVLMENELAAAQGTEAGVGEAITLSKLDAARPSLAEATSTILPLQPQQMQTPMPVPMPTTASHSTTASTDLMNRAQFDSYASRYQQRCTSSSPTPSGSRSPHTRLQQPRTTPAKKLDNENRPHVNVFGKRPGGF